MSLQTVYTFEVTALDPELIASAQTNAAGQLLIFKNPNTDYIVPGGIARTIAIGSTANITSSSFTVIGRNEKGEKVSDSVTGINNSIVETTVFFQTVEKIINVNGVGPVYAGLGKIGGLLPYTFDLNRINSGYATVQVEVSGLSGPEYNMEGTLSQFQVIRPNNLGDAGGSAIAFPTIEYFPITGLTAGSTSTLVQLDQYYSAITMVMTVLTYLPGYIRITIMQPGLV